MTDTPMAGWCNFAMRSARAAAVAALWLLIADANANAAEVQVLATTAMRPVLERIAPDFERSTGHRLLFSWGASYGSAQDSLPVRIGRGQPVDVAIMIDDALQTQIRRGRFRAKTRVGLATSRIGLAVRQGAHRPDIGTVDSTRRSLLSASSVALSDGISGRYVTESLLPRLGIADQLAGKLRIIEAPELVGQALLRNQAQVGLQQMSELLAVPGIQVVGPLPEALQRANVVAAAIAERAGQPAAAAALIAYLATPAVAAELEKAGFGPL